MNKLKKLFMPVAMLLLVCVMLTGCGKPNPQNGNGGGATEDNKLATVQNINYNEGLNKFTWDAVEHADSYNLKINSTEVNDVKTNEYSYVQTVSGSLKIQIQAVDLTGDYKKSDWAEKTFTIEIQENSLKTIIMNYAKGEVNGDLTGFVSAYATTDLKGAHHLTMHLTSKVNGEDKLSVVHGDIASGTDISSLKEIIKSSPETYFPEEYFIAENSVGKVINSMEYLLHSDMNGTSLKSNYIDKGYTISVVSSYTALDEGDTAGKNFTIYSVVKATRGDEEKLLHVTYDCRIDNLSSTLEKNVTTGLMGDRYLKQLTLQELTGDFQEATLSFVNVK